jgi:hypothetical protein
MLPIRQRAAVSPGPIVELGVAGVNFEAILVMMILSVVSGDGDVCVCSEPTSCRHTDVTARSKAHKILTSEAAPRRRDRRRHARLTPARLLEELGWPQNEIVASVRAYTSASWPSAQAFRAPQRCEPCIRKLSHLATSFSVARSSVAVLARRGNRVLDAIGKWLQLEQWKLKP